MKIKLAFLDWKFRGQSIYSTHWGLELTKGDFHSGSTFEGEIKLDRCQERELRKAILREYQPCFWISACGDEIKLKEEAPDSESPIKLLDAARHALRSYEYGNASPNLARAIADSIDAAIGKEEGR